MSIAFLVVLCLIALLWIWLLLSPAHRATYRDLLNSTTAVPGNDGSLPPVVVILAARNEATMLPRTIPTICGQEYPDLRVIVVDDQSDDQTPQVLEQLKREHANLTSIRAADRPAGWIGKCWAVHRGAEHARALEQPKSRDEPLYLFTDADICFHPRAVRQAVARLHSRNLDMLSLMPRCECVTPIERLGESGLMTLLSLLFPIGWANDPKKNWAALACGAFILVRPSAYDKVGGHQCVRSHLIEDVNLAKHLKQAGARIAVHNTRDLVTTRMYESFSDLWEGLTKNAYAGMEYQPRKFWVGLFIGIAVSVLPPIYLAIALIWLLKTHNQLAFTAFGLAITVNLCMILIHARTTRHLGLPIFYAVLFPVSAALYNTIAIDSVFQHHFRGGNVWKGRRYERGMLVEKGTEAQRHGGTNEGFA